MNASLVRCRQNAGIPAISLRSSSALYDISDIRTCHQVDGRRSTRGFRRRTFVVPGTLRCNMRAPSVVGSFWSRSGAFRTCGAALAAWGACTAHAQVGNVALSKPVSIVTGTFSGPALATINDGAFNSRGSFWQTAVWWNGTTPALEINLQSPITIRGACVQGDDNDTYSLQYRRISDGAWLPLWAIPVAGGGGMQCRPNPADTSEVFLFPTPVTTDRLRISATGGDNSYSIGELQVFDTTLLPPGQQRARALNNAVELRWRALASSSEPFLEYRIYRSTQPFTTVQALSPIATVSSIASSTFTDSTAVNGTRYYYAVTAAGTAGTEIKTVSSIGPRTPRDETDLQVLSISRLPRFDRYAPTYSAFTVTEPSGFGPYIFSSATGLGNGQTQATPHWPAIGAPITYEAKVRNRGTNPWSGTLQGEWRVDGAVVATPSQAASLAPGTSTTLSLSRTWDDQIHDVKFTILNSDARAANNSIAGGSKSVGFLTYVDESFAEDFREKTMTLYPGAATDDAFDWLNRHMERFNALFQAAGTLKRVHYDVLDPIADTSADPTASTLPFAVFPFRYRTSDIHPRQASAYWTIADDIDNGLLHEMGHQLGLIDLYQFDIAPQDNLVSGRGYSTADCLMRGVSPFVSTHSANAMTTWLHKAHGYYGQYLYKTPDQVRLRFRGIGNAPLSGAVVKMYQLIEIPGVGKRVSTQVKFQGVTDSKGYLTLPNVAINQAMAPTTAAGDTLRPNPFGYLAVVGTNGVLHFRVDHNGFTDYAWLDIVEVNNAYHAGQTQLATIDRSVALGGPIQVVPPPDLAELNAPSWTSWAQSATASVFSDATVVHNGQASIRMDTTGGFDTYVRYPADRLARWDLSAVQSIRFWARTANPNIGFQEGPIVRLLSGNGYFQWTPPGGSLNSSIGNWVEFIVPISGDATWARTSQGSPSLANINGIEIHADTWEYGFNLWLDGVRFDPPLCYPNCDASTGTPRLTANDFQCFINSFAAGSPYANCDGSASTPMLTANDFQCFLNAFAAGCP